MPEIVNTASQSSSTASPAQAIVTDGATASQAPPADVQSPASDAASQAVETSTTDKQTTTADKPQTIDTKSIHEKFQSILRGDQSSSKAEKVVEKNAGEGTPEGSGDEEGQTAPEDVEETTDKREAPKKLDSRKFEGLDEDETKWFRAMGNESYAKLYPTYLEYKKQKEVLAQKDQEITKLKESKSHEQAKVFYDHEEGYKLLPEYRGLEDEYNQASTEARIRQQQLAKVEGGEEWQEIARDKEGNYVYTGPMLPADAHAKAFLYSAITNLSVIQRDTMNKAIQFQKGYKDRYSTAAGSLEQVLFQHAPEFKDQSYAGWEVAKKLMSVVPEFANHPMTKVAGVLFAKLYEWQEKAKAESKAKEVKKVIAGDKRNGGPAVGTTQAVNKVVQPARLTIDDFRRRMELGA